MKSEHSNNLNILCIDENVNEEQYYNELLKKYSSNIIFSKNDNEAFDLYKEYSPDIIISDINNNTFDFCGHNLLRS